MFIRLHVALLRDVRVFQVQCEAAEAVKAQNAGGGQVDVGAGGGGDLPVAREP